VDLVLRHYKTDWWGERPTVFAHEAPPPDDTPLVRELLLLIDAENRRQVAIANPFGALIAQDKLSLAFFHEHKTRFSMSGRATIDAHVPLTVRLDVADRARLAEERAQWVLKSDFGCESDEVVVGAFVDDATWCTALQSALAGHFVVQRFFQAQPLSDGTLPNYGVYLLGGAPSGLLVRASPPTALARGRVVVPLLDSEEGDDEQVPR
jgi:hypothetical protein